MSIVISVFNVTPAIDVDCVDNETMLIVERDATEVMIPVGAEILAGEMLEVVLMGIVPVLVKAVLVGGFPMTTVPLVEVLVVVGAIIEGPLLERRVSEVLGVLVEEAFMEMTVEESIFDDTEDEEPEIEEPLGVAELEITMLLT